MSMLEALSWRYATKKFDPKNPVSDEQIAHLTEAVRMAPSSYGLQPYQVLVVRDPAIRAKLREAAYGQAQAIDATALFVFAAETGVDEAFVDRFVANIVTTRGVPAEAIADYVGMMKGTVNGLTPEMRTEWAARQAYLGLGVLLSTAASEKIDACPMEGFDPAKFDEILGLRAKGLATKVIAAIGNRASDDAYASYAKVRRPKDEMIVTI